jgi:hypothetical protein
MVLYRATVPNVPATNPNGQSAAAAASTSQSPAAATTVVCKKAKLRGRKARGDDFHQCALLPPGASSTSGFHVSNIDESPMAGNGRVKSERPCALERSIPRRLGRVVQVDPMKPTLKAPGAKPLKL